MGTPLILDNAVRQKISNLAVLAAGNVVEMSTLGHLLKNPEYKAAHMERMTKQTIEIPLAFLVTYSLENQPNLGLYRHMSMSVQRAGRVPNPEAVWMIAQEFGFTGDLKSCQVWEEKLMGHGIAINIIQPVNPLFSRDTKTSLAP